MEAYAGRRNPTLQELGGCVGAEASARNSRCISAPFEECKRGGEDERGCGMG